MPLEYTHTAVWAKNQNGLDFGSKYAWRQKQPLELARFIGNVSYLVQGMGSSTGNGVRSCNVTFLA